MEGIRKFNGGIVPAQGCKAAVLILGVNARHHAQNENYCHSRDSPHPGIGPERGVTGYGSGLDD
jgi:hypothetical protein